MGARSRSGTYLVALALSSGSGLLVVVDTVVVRSDGSVTAVASPVRTRLLVHALLSIVRGVVSAVSVQAGRVGVLGWALRRDGGVYGYIRVRLEMLGIILGFRMGCISSILKIQ